MSLLPPYGVFLPAALALLVFGVRFVIFATLAFYAVDPSRKPRVGYTSIERPASFDLAQNIRRELRQAALTVCIFSAVIVVLYGYGITRASLIYYEISDYPLWWFWASIPVLFLLHDTFFYWLHRAMHVRWLFELFHRRHHESVFPTAFAAYNFSALEALAEASIVVPLIFMVPAHPQAFLIFQTLSIAYNIYVHCGRDFCPESMRDHWLGRWLNTSSLHGHHHRFSHGNYSFYFTFWDRWLGTLKPVRSPHSL